VDTNILVISGTEGSAPPYVEHWMVVSFRDSALLSATLLRHL
jgi:hypothetical protein